MFSGYLPNSRMFSGHAYDTAFSRGRWPATSKSKLFCNIPSFLQAAPFVTLSWNTVHPLVKKYKSDKNISASETKAATVCKRCTHVSKHLPDESINRPVNFRPKASEQLFSATAARHLLSSRPLNLVIPNRFLLNYERAAHTHKHTGWPKKSKPLSLIIIKSY